MKRYRNYAETFVHKLSLNPAKITKYKSFDDNCEIFQRGEKYSSENIKLKYAFHKKNELNKYYIFYSFVYRIYVCKNYVLFLKIIENINKPTTFILVTNITNM